MLKHSVFVFALLASAAVIPARADDLSGRMDQMEEQIRQLTGQVEQLTYQLKQMQAQKKMGAIENTAPQTSDQAQSAPMEPQVQQSAQAQPMAPALRKKQMIQQPQVVDDGQGTETIGETPIQPPQMQQGSNPQPASAQVMQNNGTMSSTVRPLGTTRSSASNDGGFQGKVLVAPGGMVVANANDSVDDGNIGDAMTADDNSSAPQADQQQAAVQQDDPVPAAETPDDLFLRSEKALLQLQYANAEGGFKEFIAKYPDHNLAGSAEFKLGETYWAEQNYSSAAQSYMDSFKKYPKGRRAPDSLLKLGLSLARLGQRDQACATIGSVDTEYPNAVDVKKRAQAEFKRAGC